MKEREETAPNPQPSRPLEADLRRSQSRRTVAVCDDNEDILYVMAEFLKGRYNVLTAKSGEECVSLFDEEARKGNSIDVLFLDYKLKDKSGDQVARMIREGNRQLRTKVVLSTAYELDKAAVSKLFEENLIDSVLRKPFSLADFDKMLTELVG